MRTSRASQGYLELFTREPDDAECAYFHTSAAPKGLGFMFLKGRLARIDVREASIRTASCAGIGDSEEKIKQLYPGRIKVEPHHYLPDIGHYLFFEPADAADRDYMVFETARGLVTSFRTGTRAAVGFVEGCL